MTITTQIFLWMTGAIFWALSGIVVFRYYLTDLELAGNNHGGGSKYMYFAQVFAGFAAFVLVQASDSREAVATSVAQETAALHMMVMVTEASGMDNDGRIAAAVTAYGEAVVADEWREMAGGRQSPIASQRFDEVLRAFHNASADTSTPIATQMGSELTVAAVAARNQRIDVAAGNAFDDMLWMAVGLLTLITIAFNWGFGPSSVFVHMSATAMLSMTTAQLLHMAYLMSTPFAGPASLSPIQFLALSGH